MVESINRDEQLRAAEERKKRNEVGLYTIKEAVKLLLEHTKLKKYPEDDLKDLLSKLVEEKQVRNFSSFRESYLHLDFAGFLKSSKEPKIIVSWDDLNDVWLPSINVEWKFPNPFKKKNTIDESLNEKVVNVWSDERLEALHKESLEPGVTHKSLGEKYNVKRQRITALLKRYKEKRKKTFRP